MDESTPPADELLSLEQQHARLKARIAEMGTRPFLSEREQAERKRLQKMKLAIKDKIVRLGGREA